MKSNNLATYASHRDLIQPLLYMQTRGLWVDREGMKAHSVRITEEALDKQKELETLVGYPINPHSTQQGQKYFYDEKGIDGYKNRKTGRPSLDEEALKRLSRRGFREADLILELHGIKKLKSSYLDIKFSDDGRLRSSFNPVGARSGRLSSSKDIFGIGLNLQTLPNTIKQHIGADPGYIIYNLDKAQAENRIVAYIAPDFNMIDAFERGIDIHCRTAGLVLQKPEDQISREDGSCPLGNGTRSERYWGKETNHALNYKEGVEGFSLQVGLPKHIAAEIRQRYLSGYPGIVTWWNTVLDYAKRNKFLINLFGRKYAILERIDESTWSKILFFIPQSTVADVINRWGLIYIWNEREGLFKNLELLNQVHDAIVFQLPVSLGWAEHYRQIELIIKSLNQPLFHDGRRFVIPTDLKMGVRFSDMDELKGKKFNEEGFKKSFERFC